MIHQSVIDGWHAFSEPLEGRVPHPYLDKLGLVTCAVGNLIDSKTNAAAGLRLALALPWLHLAIPATHEEVTAQWTALRGARYLASRHYREARAFLERKFGWCITLSEEAIDELVATRRAQMATELERNHFPEFSSWPADAQLACLSMAWAMGSDFPRKFPSFSAACRARRWDLAAARCKMREEGNPGVVPRNALNAAHFQAASSDFATDWPALLAGPCTLGALRAGWAPATPYRESARRIVALAAA